MAHHKPITKISTTGLKVRLRRQRKSSRPKMTKAGGWYDTARPNPNPDGAKPTTGWVLYTYPLEKKGRKHRAEQKRRERRQLMRTEKREALKDQD